MEMEGFINEKRNIDLLKKLLVLKMILLIFINFLEHLFISISKSVYMWKN